MQRGQRRMGIHEVLTCKVAREDGNSIVSLAELWQEREWESDTPRRNRGGQTGYVISQRRLERTNAHAKDGCPYSERTDDHAKDGMPM